MRDKIADVVFNKRYGNDNSGMIAGEIIAALPGMIRPLEWDYIDPSTKGAFGVAGQRYTIWAMDSCGYVVFPGTSVGERFKGGIVAAIAAANAHHAATIMGAFE